MENGSSGHGWSRTTARRANYNEVWQSKAFPPGRAPAECRPADTATHRKRSDRQCGTHRLSKPAKGMGTASGMSQAAVKRGWMEGSLARTSRKPNSLAEIDGSARTLVLSQKDGSPRAPGEAIFIARVRSRCAARVMDAAQLGGSGRGSFAGNRVSRHGRSGSGDPRLTLQRPVYDPARPRKAGLAGILR